jgi:hypothetical protein
MSRVTLWTVTVFVTCVTAMSRLMSHEGKLRDQYRKTLL